MYSALFLLQAAVQLALLAWLLAIRQRTGLAIAAVLLVPQFGLVYDNLIVGLGATIGLGPILEALSWPRFWLHWIAGCWLVVACGSILRVAGLAEGRWRGIVVVSCALTAALMAYDLPHFWRDSLYPVCEFDLVRYSTAVAPGAGCLPGQAVIPGSPPFASIVTCLVVIATGAVLLAKRRFPWMLVGGLLMLVSASPPMMRLKLDNFGEILIAGGVIWALARFSRASA